MKDIASWRDCLSEILEPIGVQLSATQLDSAASDLQLHSEMLHEISSYSTGWTPGDDPVKRAKDELTRKHNEELAHKDFLIESFRNHIASKFRVDVNVSVDEFGSVNVYERR